MWSALEGYPKPHVAPLEGGLDVNQQTDGAFFYFFLPFTLIVSVC